MFRRIVASILVLLGLPDAKGNLSRRDRVRSAFWILFMPSPFVSKLVQEANDLEALQEKSDAAASALSAAQSSLAKVEADANNEKALADAAYNVAVANALSAKTSSYTSADSDVSSARKAVDDAIASANEAAAKLQSEQTYLINSIKNLSFDTSGDPTPNDSTAPAPLPSGQS